MHAAFDRYCVGHVPWYFCLNACTDDVFVYGLEIYVDSVLSAVGCSRCYRVVKP